LESMGFEWFRQQAWGDCTLTGDTILETITIYTIYFLGRDIVNIQHKIEREET
jgi:hypothetical protein